MVENRKGCCKPTDGTSNSNHLHMSLFQLMGQSGLCWRLMWKRLSTFVQKDFRNASFMILSETMHNSLKHGLVACDDLAIVRVKNAPFGGVRTLFFKIDIHDGRVADSCGSPSRPVRGNIGISAVDAPEGV